MAANTPKAEKADTKAVEADNAEVQAIVDDAEEKGYIGHAPDPNPNLAYSPQTGPDAPPLVEDAYTRTPQHTLPKEV